MSAREGVHGIAEDDLSSSLMKLLQFGLGMSELGVAWQCITYRTRGMSELCVALLVGYLYVDSGWLVLLAGDTQRDGELRIALFNRALSQGCNCPGQGSRSGP